MDSHKAKLIGIIKEIFELYPDSFVITRTKKSKNQVTETNKISCSEKLNDDNNNKLEKKDNLLNRKRLNDNSIEKILKTEEQEKKVPDKSKEVNIKSPKKEIIKKDVFESKNINIKREEKNNNKIQDTKDIKKEDARKIKENNIDRNNYIKKEGNKIKINYDLIEINKIKKKENDNELNESDISKNKNTKINEIDISKIRIEKVNEIDNKSSSLNNMLSEKFEIDTEKKIEINNLKENLKTIKKLKVEKGRKRKNINKEVIGNIKKSELNGEDLSSINDMLIIKQDDLIPLNKNRFILRYINGRHSKQEMLYNILKKYTFFDLVEYIIAQIDNSIEIYIYFDKNVIKSKYQFQFEVYFGDVFPIIETENIENEIEKLKKADPDCIKKIRSIKDINQNLDEGSDKDRIKPRIKKNSKNKNKKNKRNIKNKSKTKKNKKTKK